MKILISCSRYCIPLELYQYIFTLLQTRLHILIYGTATGVDSQFAFLCINYG